MIIIFNKTKIILFTSAFIAGTFILMPMAVYNSLVSTVVDLGEEQSEIAPTTPYFSALSNRYSLKYGNLHSHSSYSD